MGRMKLSLACVSLFALGASFLVTDGAHAADQRTYAASRFTVAVSGVLLAPAKTFDGGTLAADTAPERGPLFPKRHVANVHVEPIELEVPLDSKVLNGWAAELLDGSTATKSVSLALLDLNLKETSRNEYDRVRLVQLVFPALDAASLDPAYVQATLQPEAIRRAPGASTTASAGGAAHGQRLNNFRVTVDKMPTARVSKVGAITVKAVPTGGRTVSNLVLTISEADLKPWQDWQDTFLGKGENSDAAERSGSVEYLAADMTTVTAKLNFRGLGLIRVAPDKMAQSSDAVRRFTAEMYVEDVKLVSK